MSRAVRRRSKQRAQVLSMDQRLELTIGPTGRDRIRGQSAFASDLARRRAWIAHRLELLDETPGGTRPWAWWQYDAPAGIRDGSPQAREAYLASVMTPAEREEIARLNERHRRVTETRAHPDSDMEDSE